MEDTAQPLAAETPLHDQIDDAARALRAMRTVSQPRSEDGKFAGEPRPEEPDESEAEEAEVEAEPEANDETEEYEDEGPEEDQPESVEMPKSWSKEDEETWHNLPPEAQAKIAEREGQRDTAVNSKFQEAATARKQYEERLAEANESRDKWAKDYDNLVADLELPKPDPRQYGLGTQRYDRDAYDLAMLQWEQGTQSLQSLKQQREEIRAQQEKEELESWNATKAEIEAKYAPQLLSIMPELKDPQKATASMQGLVQFAIEQGVKPETFSEENQPFITAAELRILALAREALNAKGVKAPPKKQPALKPGVTTPRRAQKTVARKQAMERLSTENSIEAAAAAMRAVRR